MSIRIIVTGGSGFIGSHVVDLLSSKGNEVFVLDDLSTGHLEWIQEMIKSRKNVHFDMCDITNLDHVRGAFSVFRPQAVCHLAAQPAISTSWTDPYRNAMVNEIGTLNLIDAMREFGTRRIVFASTSAVYRETSEKILESDPKEPSSPYGISKLAAEGYLRTLTNSVILRLGNVYGPRQVPIGENQVIPLMFRHLLKGDKFQIHGHGNQKRDFVFVDDVADAFLMGLWGGPGIYNIATGVRTSVVDLSNFIEELCDAKGHIWDHSEKQDPRQDVRLSRSAASKGMGWNPKISIYNGLTQTFLWWMKQN